MTQFLPIFNFFGLIILDGAPTFSQADCLEQVSRQKAVLQFLLEKSKFFQGGTVVHFNGNNFYEPIFLDR